MNHSASIGIYYLNLQYRRAIRLLKDNGIFLWLAIPILLMAYVFLTYRLLSGFAFGELIYPALGLSISTSLIDQRKYDFIKSISSTSSYRLIRFAEQFLILIPFIIGLLLFGWNWIALFLFVATIAVSFVNINISLPSSFPTPFGSRPFEFSRGFRGSILLIIGCYILVPIGLTVDNFNLAIASIAGIGLISGNYFLKPEPRFYVWVHSMTPRQFIIEKSKSILFYTLICIVPIAIGLMIYDPSRYTSILLMVLAAIAFIEMCMLAKYYAYPSEINIVAGLGMGLSILFPPLMLIIVPVFYFKAKKRLNTYLR